MNQRKLSLINNTNNLEHLHTFKQVPISMGCTSEDQSKDILQDQIWDICKDTGIIQLRNPLPLKLVYAFPHNDGIGKVWEDHYQSFANFINKFNVNKVLEIGGGAGRLGKVYLNKSPLYSWTMVEPNHSYQTIDNPNFKHIMEWFDKILSVELIHSLFSQCCYRFIDEPNVKLFHGNSSDKMSEMLDLIDSQTLFWLDGHVDGVNADCLWDELEHIKSHNIKTHTIIVDDIPLYFGDGEKVKSKILEINPNYQFIIEDALNEGNGECMQGWDLIAFIP